MAIRLSGSGAQYLSGSDAGLPAGNASRTIMGWVYVDTLRNYGSVLTYGSRSTGALVGVWTGAPQGTLFTQYGASIIPLIPNVGAYWVHYAMVFDVGSGLWTMYGNGQPLGFAPHATDTVLSALYIGSDSANDYLLGAVEDVRIFNGGKTLAQLAEIVHGKGIDTQTDWLFRLTCFGVDGATVTGPLVDDTGDYSLTVHGSPVYADGICNFTPPSPSGPKGLDRGAVIIG